MHQLVLSCSLSPSSKSAILARRMEEEIRGLNDDVRLIDLRDFPLPFCDAAGCYENANVRELGAAIKSASAITIATPIYNYETGGSTRNVLALGGDAWENKIVGFLCAAGGQGSYMAVMSLVNSLMLDFRCIIVPRFVYATGQSFADGKLADPKVEQRIADLASELHRVAGALG